MEVGGGRRCNIYTVHLDSRRVKSIGECSQISGYCQGPPAIRGHELKANANKAVVCFSLAFSTEYAQVQIGRVLDFVCLGLLEERDDSYCGI